MITLLNFLRIANGMEKITLYDAWKENTILYEGTYSSILHDEKFNKDFLQYTVYTFTVDGNNFTIEISNL